jgi:ferric-dicitrate binding protein FerR (iron transport regulator)
LDNTVNHIDELIGKYLAGEATASEATQVEAWADEGEANRKYLAQFKMIFEGAGAVKELHRFDEDAAWNKMKSKLRSEERVVNFQPESSHLKLYLRIAASIIVILSIGFFVYKSTTSSLVTPLEVIAESKTVSDKLPDGSGVVLNKKTSLKYVFDKKKETHIVKLTGEAFFNIKHDEKKHFVIDVEGAFIRDIGTSFNVKAYPESNTVEVVVEEGVVEFFTEKDSGILLYASSKGTFDKLTGKFSIEQPEQNVAAYRNKFFSFSNSDLASVVDDLNNVYDKKITIGHHLKKCHLTVTFNNENIDEIASVIAETLGLTVKESPQEIILEGPGCE